MGVRETKSDYKVLIDSNIILQNDTIEKMILQLAELKCDFGAPHIEFEVNETEVSLKFTN